MKNNVLILVILVFILGVFISHGKQALFQPTEVLKPRTTRSNHMTLESYPIKSRKHYVIKNAWCFWLGCASAKYYNACCKIWLPYCKDLECKRRKDDCPHLWASLNSTGCYRIVTAETFKQAKDFCEQDKGRLVEINDSNQKELSKFYKDSHINGWVWIGAKRGTRKDEWRWIFSGKKITFNFGNKIRGKSTGNKKCLIWNGIKQWKPISCDQKNINFKAICEENREETVKPPNCHCGIPNNAKKIVGGTETERNKYPWQVRLEIGITKARCSGSLISSRTVLTAAHCVEEEKSEDIIVFIGDHDVEDDNDGQIQMKVKAIIQNSLYNPSTLDYDLSLLILSKEIIFDEKTNPICLPDLSKNYENIKATVSGWGVLFEGGQTSNILQEVEVMTMTNAECTSKTKYNSSEITQRMICAAGDGKAACQGDSGGPLASMEPSGYFSIIGVVSWGHGCAEKQSPGVYSRVVSEMSWIKDRIEGQMCLIPDRTTTNLPPSSSTTPPPRPTTTTTSTTKEGRTTTNLPPSSSTTPPPRPTTTTTSTTKEDDPGKPTMSSEYSPTYSAVKCWDGDLDTYCYNQAAGDTDPYFMVEFNVPIMVKRVTLIVTNYTDYAQYAKNIEVFVTNDKESSGPATEALQRIVIDSKDGVTGRFVIVRKKEAGIITFAEVEITKGARVFTGSCLTDANVPTTSGNSQKIKLISKSKDDCYDRCKDYIQATGCEFESSMEDSDNMHMGRPCIVHFQDILKGNGDISFTCLDFNTEQTPIGFAGRCLTNDGNVQTSGTSRISVIGKSKGDCYDLCKEFPQATGCEFRGDLHECWGTHSLSEEYNDYMDKGRSCIVHTQDIVKENGKDISFTCWIFNSQSTD